MGACRRPPQSLSRHRRRRAPHRLPHPPASPTLRAAAHAPLAQSYTSAWSTPWGAGAAPSGAVGFVRVYLHGFSAEALPPPASLQLGAYAAAPGAPSAAELLVLMAPPLGGAKYVMAVLYADGGWGCAALSAAGGLLSFTAAAPADAAPVFGALQGGSGVAAFAAGYTLPFAAHYVGASLVWPWARSTAWRDTVLGALFLSASSATPALGAATTVYMSGASRRRRARAHSPARRPAAPALRHPQPFPLP